MKFKHFALIILLLPAALIFGQKANHEKKPSRFIQLSLLAPVSTDLIGAGPYSHHLSFNIISGVDYNLNGLALGLFNVSLKNSTGLQLGLWNIANEFAKGMQLGILVNVSGIRLIGVQWGLVNIALGSGGVGWQWGFVNVSGFLFKGYQGALIENYARKMSGFQMALINQADEMNGVQIGIINRIGKGGGIPIGIFNFFPSGVNRLQVALDSDTVLNIDWHIGWKYFHKIFKLNYKFTSAVTPVFNGTWGVGFGAGFLIPVADVWEIRLQNTINFDFYLFNLSPYMDIRLYGTYQYSNRHRVIAGFDLKYFLSDGTSPYNYLLDQKKYFSFFAGLEFGK